MKRKKVVSLAVALVVGSFALSSFAYLGNNFGTGVLTANASPVAELVKEYTEDDFVFVPSVADAVAGLSQKGVETLKTNNGVLVIPHKVGNRTIKKISFRPSNIPLSWGVSPQNYPEVSENLFSNFREIKKVTILEGIELIDTAMFMGLTNLTEVKLPESLKKIKEAAFCDTSLTEINFPSNLTEIDNGTFAKVNTLTEVVIPKNIKKISSDAFLECSSLRKVRFHDELTEIGSEAFKNSGLTEVEIPTSLTEISEGCFANTKIKKVVIPKNIKKVGYYSFLNDYFGKGELEEVIFEGGDESKLENIGASAFRGQKISSVVLPKNLKSLGVRAFSDNYSLTKIVYTGPIEKIMEGTFELAGDESDIEPEIVIQDGLKTIGDSAFERKGIKNFTFFKSITKVGKSAFWLNRMRTLEIPDTLLDIDGTAFYSPANKGGWVSPRGGGVSAVYRLNDNGEYVMDGSLKDASVNTKYFPSYTVNPVLVKIVRVDKAGNELNKFPEKYSIFKFSRVGMYDSTRNNSELWVFDKEDINNFKLGDKISLNNMFKECKLLLPDGTPTDEISLISVKRARDVQVPENEVVKDVYYTDDEGNDLGYNIPYKMAVIKIQLPIEPETNEDPATPGKNEEPVTPGNNEKPVTPGKNEKPATPENPGVPTTPVIPVFPSITPSSDIINTGGKTEDDTLIPEVKEPEINIVTPDENPLGTTDQDNGYVIADDEKPLGSAKIIDNKTTVIKVSDVKTPRGSLPKTGGKDYTCFAILGLGLLLLGLAIKRK